MVIYLQYNEASGSVITPCNKIDKPLMVYRFTGNVMTSAYIMTKLNVFQLKRDVKVILMSYDK